MKWLSSMSGQPLQRVNADHDDDGDDDDGGDDGDDGDDDWRRAGNRR